MNNRKYVFSQLLDFLDRNDFNYLVRKYGGDKYVKQFTCYNQLAVLMFGQLSNRESLRDLVLATQAHASKAYHLGFGKYASKSTLADANNKRDYRIFEEFAYKVVAEARTCRADDIFKLGGNVYAFDSTTIELCLEAFKWALYRKNQGKGGIKVHTLYDIETSIPTFFHITEARVHDMRAMDVIPYEENSFYIFDRGYNDFKRLYNIESIGAYFVVRGKKNNDFKPGQMGEAFSSRIRHPVRCHRLHGRVAHQGEVSRQDQAYQVLGRREQANIHILHQCIGCQPDNGCRAVSSEMAD